MFINIRLKVFILITIIIERERNLLHLPEAINYINVNRLLVCRCRSVVEPERFILQRVKVIGQVLSARRLWKVKFRL